MDLFNFIGSVFQAPPSLPIDPAIGVNKLVSRGNPDTNEDFSRRIGPRTCGTRVSKIDIGAPTGFKHMSHVGFNAHEGWDSCFLSDYASNSDLQLIFTKAGIREEHLTDRRTSIKIFEIIERSGLMRDVRKEGPGNEPSKGASAPPARGLLTSEVGHPYARGPRARIRREVANEPIVPLLPPPKLSSMPSLLPSPVPPLSPYFTQGAALNSGLDPLDSPLQPSFRSNKTLNSDPIALVSTLPSSSMSNAALNSNPVPLAPPLPPFINNAALNSDLVPPAPPLPTFVNNTAFNSNPVPPAPPLPPIMNNTALNSALIPPAPPIPPFVNNGALNSNPVPPAPPLPPTFTNNAALNSNQIPPAPPLPPSFLNNAAIISNPVPPAPPLPPSFMNNTAIISNQITPAPPLLPSIMISAALNSDQVPQTSPLPPSCLGFVATDEVPFHAAPSADEYAVADQAPVPPAPPLPPNVQSTSAPPPPVNNCAEDWIPASEAPVPPVLNIATSLLTDPNAATPALTSCDLFGSHPTTTQILQLPLTFNSTASATSTLDQPPSCGLSTSPAVLPACSPSADNVEPLHAEVSVNSVAPVVLRRSRNNTTIRIKPNRSGIMPTDQSNRKQLVSMEPPNLMDQIRRGIHLKSTKDAQINADAVSAPLAASENEDLVKALMEVIRKRDRVIRLPSEDSSEDEWED